MSLVFESHLLWWGGRETRMSSFKSWLLFSSVLVINSTAKIISSPKIDLLFVYSTCRPRITMITFPLMLSLCYCTFNLHFFFSDCDFSSWLHHSFSSQVEDKYKIIKLLSSHLWAVDKSQTNFSWETSRDKDKKRVIIEFKNKVKQEDDEKEIVCQLYYLYSPVITLHFNQGMSDLASRSPRRTTATSPFYS